MKSSVIWPTSSGGLGWHEVLGGGLAGGGHHDHLSAGVRRGCQMLALR